jgi:hypothetical protein
LCRTALTFLAIAVTLSLPDAPRSLAQAVTPPPKPAAANDAPPLPGDNIRYGYSIHQSIDFGGHIVEQYGNESVYDNLVNLQSGARILDQSLEMRAVDPAKALLFDHLFTSSFGYGGDPNNVSILNFSKGKIYDFRGSFRRDRQYFDYNLLANPLIPPASTPYVPVLNSPHLYNTVRRMTDVAVTIAPLSPISARFAYSHNINEGPSYSSIHVGADALLTQNWRNLTNTYDAGVDWKLNPRTVLSYDEFVTQYKGDTTWQLTGLNYQLSDATPVSLGVDLSSLWAAPCAAPFLADGTVNPTCNAFLSYNRYAPTRSLFPTEQLLFQSSSLPHFTMNGRLRYTAANSNLNNFYELFNGLDSRVAVRQTLVTGSARVQRVNVNGDFAVSWEITPKITATDVFDFWDFRMPGTNTFTETDSAGTSLLTPPAATTTTTTPDYQFLNQKTKANTFLVAWDASSRASLSIGFRYRARLITDAGGDIIPIHENWGLFGAALRPLPQWRVNFNVEAMYADNSFVRIDPRQLQHYILRSTYKPRTWLTFAGAVNILEERDNVQTVNYLAHNRDYSFGTSIAPAERWSLDLNYGYNDANSSVIQCYASTPAPPSAGVAPAVCIAAGTPLLSNGYYNAPTQFGSLGFTWTPMQRAHLNGGYRITSVNGTTTLINVRQVPGSLQSQFQSPYANFAFNIAPSWTWKADYNYYGYGEATPEGPTLPRPFHSNIYTLAVNYQF